MFRTLAFTLCTLLAAGAADASGRFVARGGHANANGGITTGHTSGFRGPNGSEGAHGRKTSSDGQGNITSNTRGEWRGANGSTASTESTATRGADGTRTFDRDTTATGRNGNSYTGSTSVTKDGISHTGSCTNASGQAIACR